MCGVYVILFCVVWQGRTWGGVQRTHETGRCTRVKVVTEIFIQTPVLFTSSQITSGAASSGLQRAVADLRGPLGALRPTAAGFPE